MVTTTNMSLLVPAVGAYDTLGTQLNAAHLITDPDADLNVLVADETAAFAKIYSFQPPVAGDDIHGKYASTFVAGVRPHFESAVTRLLAINPSLEDLKSQDLVLVNYPDMVRAGLLTFDSAEKVVDYLDDMINDMHKDAMYCSQASLPFVLWDAVLWGLGGGFVFNKVAEFFASLNIDPSSLGQTSAAMGLAFTAGLVLSARKYRRLEKAHDDASESMKIRRDVFDSDRIYDELETARDEYAAKQAALTGPQPRTGTSSAPDTIGGEKPV